MSVCIIRFQFYGNLEWSGGQRRKLILGRVRLQTPETQPRTPAPVSGSLACSQLFLLHTWIPTQPALRGQLFSSLWVMGQGSFRTVCVIPEGQPVTILPAEMSFCAKGHADLLSVPSSSKVQTKISISGDCGAVSEAGVLAPNQLGEQATFHLLTRHTHAPLKLQELHM